MPTEPEVPWAKAMDGRPVLHGHFAGGALESASHILGSASASVFAAGLVLPFVAAMGAPHSMDGREVFAISALALLFSMLTGVGAVLLRGLAHCAPHNAAWRALGERQGDAG